MTDRLAESQGKEPESPPVRSRRLQWNLQTLFLLTAAVAVWVGYFRYREPLPGLKQQVAEMQRMTTELVVVDPKQIAFTRQPEPWKDRQRWDIFLPEDGYVIRLATREIDEDGFAPVVGETAIRGGRHRIELRRFDNGEGRELVLTVNGSAVIKAHETSSWDPGFGGDEDWCGYDWRLSSDTGVILMRRRFRELRDDGAHLVPAGPTNGMLLWIERVTPADSR